LIGIPAERRARGAAHDRERGLGCGLLLDLRIDETHESGCIRSKDAEELRTKHVEGRKIGKLGEFDGREYLLVQDAHFDFELLLLVEELLQNLGYAGRVLAANDDCGGAGEDAVNLG